MNVYILNFLNYILILFESIMASYLGGCFFKRKYSRGLYVFAIVIMFILCIVYLKLFGKITFLKLFAGIILHTVWYRFVFETDLGKSLFLAVFLVSFWYIFDMLCLSGISFLIDMDYSIILSSPYEYFLLCMGIKIFEFFGLVLSCACIKHRNRLWSMAWIDWLRILFFPFSSLLIICVLLGIYHLVPELSDKLMLCALILLFADVMSVFLLDHLENQQVAIRDNVILQQELKIERESISAWVEAYREERKRSHDFQNQLAVLRGMADELGRSDQFVQYLDSLLNVELPKTRYINTNRPVADVLISQKVSIARNKGVNFRIQLDDLSHFPLSDDEIVVVFANLLDNAIVASEKVPDEIERYVLIRAKCTPEVSYLYIENPTTEPVTIKNNRVVVKQCESTGHGFGLQNVTKILDRRHVLYAFVFQPEKNIFSFSAQFME